MSAACLGQSLRGIRVLDFSQMAAGPTCSLLLADLGAEVLKIEPPGGDLARQLGPAWVGEDSALFHALNRDKRGACLDLKTAEGVATARRLAAGADVLLESNRPGVMARLGLGPDDLLRAHPRLVYCSISAYGQQGPYAHKAGVDGILQADSGLMSLLGTPGGEPCKVQSPIVDVMTGHLAALAIVAALQGRERTGAGGHVDVNLLNAALALQAPSLASYLCDGAAPDPLGSAAPYSAPNEAFQTADGWVMVAAYIGDRWERLCAVLGREDLATDARFATSEARVRHREAMRQALNACFRVATTEHWIARLERADILCARVAGYADLLRHPQVAANGVVAQVEVAGYGALRLPGPFLGARGARAAAPARQSAGGEVAWA